MSILTIGKLLKCIREEQGLSQEQFASLFGRAQRDISFFEADRAVSHKEFLNAVAVRFNDEVLSAYICGERDRDHINMAVMQFAKTGEMTYA